MPLNILYTAVVVELDDVDVVVNDGMPVMRQVHAEVPVCQRINQIN
jgi:hypothetical protein